MPDKTMIRKINMLHENHCCNFPVIRVKGPQDRFAGKEMKVEDMRESRSRRWAEHRHLQ